MMLGKDGAGKFLSIFRPEETYRIDWSSGVGQGPLLRLLQCFGVFFASILLSAQLFFSIISRISVTIIAMKKQYSRSVCYNLVMRRSLPRVKK